ncbi:MAG: Unknown protein [uncultured Sulfurovum sp.]|uniref:Uncharacterized protein n=1 Tax=uncultured Sulfurovum sp. TaxID=269237 RepID=A0A6S6SJW3_9BACT|nr:MAG: Unknown protein [uncultured Sulfurovum sp.]
MMQTIQFNVENKYLEIVLNLLNNLNGLKFNIIKDLSINPLLDEEENEEQQELSAFSNHTANLIDEWKDEKEDSVWI